MSRKTTREIRAYKHKQKITMITAYDALFANLFDEYADIILVGDSLNMSFGGEVDTIKNISMKKMIYHAQAVCRGSSESMVVLDMPFGTYSNKKQALKNAILAMKKSNISAVKLEGGEEIAPIIKHLNKNSIATMGHIGLLPQNVRQEGGYIVKGRDNESSAQLIKDTKALSNAGVFAIVCEGVKASAAKEIAESTDIPIIGIGAGKDVDGQVLVFSDMLGLFEKFEPKFSRKYLDGGNLVRSAIERYKEDVESGGFPLEEESY